MKPTLIMHVNYCEQGQPLDAICRKAVDRGFDGVEVRRQRSHVEEEPDRYIDALASETERAGLKQVIFGSPGPELMTPDHAPELYARLYRRDPALPAALIRWL